MYRSLHDIDEIWTGKIERLSWGGLGLARDPEGRIILLSAPLALFPNEEVEARVRWKARHGEGEVLRWITRDPRRVPASCPVAERCGGCTLWESGELATHLKYQMAEDLFRRQMPEHPTFRWLPAPDWAKRHRIQVHWNGHDLGFHERKSHRLITVESCPAAVEPVSQAIPRLREALMSGALPKRTQRWELAVGTPPETVFATDEMGMTWRLAQHTWEPSRDPVIHRRGSLELRHRAGSFFQVCAPWAMEAFGSLLETWDLKGSTLYDLYGGVGLFSALLGTRFRHRILVEGHPEAVSWAIRNLDALQLPTECVAADVSQWLPEHLGNPDDVILLDPPRSGLDSAVTAKLLTARAGSLVLVGCDGAAFCRDLKRLAAAWTVRDLAVLDLFPLTPHMECVAWLVRDLSEKRGESE